ncbi:MAG: energy-coupling factor ABC transporter permease [Rhodospirillales bacterium]|jgi:cobalt/nickel transport system permease protein|nr:energy-coupling factor ABC transporter permease [Rhodospirillales bacterium]
MHMADALLSPAVGAGMWAVTGTAIAVASAKMKKSLDQRQVPLMGIMGALVFSVQMLNFTIPGTGSSGHFAGGLLLAILLGPHAGFLTIASVVTVQALFFADGGLLALGANIFNMGFLACYIVYPFLYRPFAVGKQAKPVTWLCAVLALQLGAFGVVLQTSLSGIAELPFSTFLLAMQPIHLAIGIGEGLITLAVVELLARTEPGLLRADRPALPGKRALAALAVLAVLSGGIFSWFASSHPDGLEWSIGRLVGEGKELEGADDGLHALAAQIQEKLSFLPDYGFPKTEAEGAEEAAAEDGFVHPDAGTTLSGLVGGAIVLALAMLAGMLLKRRPETA